MSFWRRRLVGGLIWGWCLVDFGCFWLILAWLDIFIDCVKWLQMYEIALGFVGGCAGEPDETPGYWNFLGRRPKLHWERVQHLKKRFQGFSSSFDICWMWVSPGKYSKWYVNDNKGVVRDPQKRQKKTPKKDTRPGWGFHQQGFFVAFTCTWQWHSFQWSQLMHHWENPTTVTQPKGSASHRPRASLTTSWLRSPANLKRS